MDFQRWFQCLPNMPGALDSIPSIGGGVVGWKEGQEVRKTGGGHRRAAVLPLRLPTRMPKLEEDSKYPKAGHGDKSL